jgi:hypothetical protein
VLLRLLFHSNTLVKWTCSRKSQSGNGRAVAAEFWGLLSSCWPVIRQFSSQELTILKLRPVLTKEAYKTAGSGF